MPRAPAAPAPAPAVVRFPTRPAAEANVLRPARAPGGGFARPLKPEDDRDKRFSDAGKAVSRTRGEPKRREGRLTIQSVAGDGDTAERMRSLASVRRAREREKEKRKGGSTDAPNRPREVVIPDVITVQELSNRMAVRGVDIVKFLMKQGLMMKINDVIDTDTAELVADEFGMTVRRVRNPTSRPASCPTRSTTRRSRRARRSWPSWATSTTARPRCSMRCAPPTWQRARPAASPSTSAPIR